MPYPALLLNFSPALSLHSALCHHIFEIVLVLPQGDVAIGSQDREDRTGAGFGFLQVPSGFPFLFFIFLFFGG